MYINLVKLIPHMLDQVRLKVQKHQFRSQMHIPLNNACETHRCLIVDRWSNDGSDSVIVIIVATVSLIVDDHIVQDDAIIHDQPGSALRIILLSLCIMLRKRRRCFTKLMYNV
jgi:hypothetical protein